jgi:cytochrome c biogenesis protein CcdA
VIISLLALALVDSINPSAIAVTLCLLAQGRTATHVAIYIAAVFVTYLGLGATMMLGIDVAVPNVRALAQSRLGLIVQSLIGLAMLVYAMRAPAFSRSRPRTEPQAANLAALALLGVTVTGMELPTAVPYMGAIAILTAADLSTARWLLLLVGYNTIFVLPPVLLLAGHLVAGRRMVERYAALRARLQAGAHQTMLWVLGVVGSVLLVTSSIEYVVRFVLRRS